jgi:hypothetical protein
MQWYAVAAQELGSQLQSSLAMDLVGKIVYAYTSTKA